MIRFALGLNHCISKTDPVHVPLLADDRLSRYVNVYFPNRYHECPCILVMCYVQLLSNHEIISGRAAQNKYVTSFWRCAISTNGDTIKTKSAHFMEIPLINIYVLNTIFLILPFRISIIRVYYLDSKIFNLDF